MFIKKRVQRGIFLYRSDYPCFLLEDGARRPPSYYGMQGYSLPSIRGGDGGGAVFCLLEDGAQRPPFYFLDTLFGCYCLGGYTKAAGDVCPRPLYRFAVCCLQSVVFSLLFPVCCFSLLYSVCCSQSAFYIFFFTVLYRDLLPYVVDVDVAHCA